MSTDPRSEVASDPRASESGLSLVELMMATVLTVVGLVAIMHSCIRLHALQRLDTELGFAYRACRTNIDQLRSTALATLPTLDGTGFDVPGPDGVTPYLRAADDDADGLPGAISVRQVAASGGRVSYRIETTVSWVGASGPHNITFATLWGGAP